MRVPISRSTKNMQGKWQNEVGRQLWYLLPSKDMSLGNPNYYRAIGIDLLTVYITEKSFLNLSSFRPG